MRRSRKNKGGIESRIPAESGRNPVLPGEVLKGSDRKKHGGGES